MNDNIQEAHLVQRVAEIHRDLKEKAIFLAEYAATLEAVGVQTSRIQYNTIRIAKSFGYWCNILMFPQLRYYARRKTLEVTINACIAFRMMDVTRTESTLILM